MLVVRYRRKASQQNKARNAHLQHPSIYSILLDYLSGSPITSNAYVIEYCYRSRKLFRWSKRRVPSDEFVSCPNIQSSPWINDWADLYNKSTLQDFSARVRSSNFLQCSVILCSRFTYLNAQRGRDWRFGTLKTISTTNSGISKASMNYRVRSLLWVIHDIPEMNQFEKGIGISFWETLRSSCDSWHTKNRLWLQIDHLILNCSWSTSTWACFNRCHIQSRIANLNDVKLFVCWLLKMTWSNKYQLGDSSKHRLVSFITGILCAESWNSRKSNESQTSNV